MTILSLPVEAIIPAMLFAAVTAGTPGPANMLLLAMGSSVGFRRSMAFLFGTFAGFSLVLLVAALGVNTLFVLYPAAHTAFTVLSALYLLYLAWKIAGTKLPLAGGDTDAAARQSGFFQGAAVHPLNPKAWAMATSAFAQFADPVAPVALQWTAITAVFLIGGLPMNAIWVWAGDRIVGLIQDDTKRRLINISMAGLTVAIVVYMSAMQLNL